MVSTTTARTTRPASSGQGRTAHAARLRFTVLTGALAGVLAVGTAAAWWATRPSGVDAAGSVAHHASPAVDSEVQHPPRSPSQAPPLAARGNADAPLRVRVLALEQDPQGRWLARVQAGDGPPRLAQGGDVIAHGLRVERIEPGRVTLRRGLQLEMLVAPMPAVVLQKPIEPLPTRSPGVIVSPPGREPPRSSAVDRAILRAKPGGADRSDWLSAHSTGH